MEGDCAGVVDEPWNRSHVTPRCCAESWNGRTVTVHGATSHGTGRMKITV